MIDIDRSFQILDLSHDASYDEAKSAYRRLAHDLHPDKHMHEEGARQEATFRFQELKNAWDVVDSFYKYHQEAAIEQERQRKKEEARRKAEVKRQEARARAEAERKAEESRREAIRKAEAARAEATREQNRQEQSGEIKFLVKTFLILLAVAATIWLGSICLGGPLMGVLVSIVFIVIIFIIFLNMF